VLRGLLRAGLALAPIVVTGLAPLGASANQTLVISAGSESKGGDVQLNEFAPNQISVNVGDTVTWRLDSTEFHDILFTSGAPAPEFVQPGPDGVFINPVAAMPTGGNTYDGTGLVGSGLLNKGDTWSLTFSKAGSYTYLCAIHTGMGGIINVLAPGQQTDTQAAVDTRRTNQVNADIANLAVPAIMANTGELPAEGAIGLAAGVQNGLADVQRFFPGTVTVHAGEAVTWIWKTADTPHTVTFLAGQPAPATVLPVPQPNGPPRLQLNPQVAAPAGSPIDYDGGSFLNSGLVQPIPGQPTPTFTVHFDSPGSYQYVCLLHEGMVGTINVLPDN
jgi:plastocyanin